MEQQSTIEINQATLNTHSIKFRVEMFFSKASCSSIKKMHLAFDAHTNTFIWELVSLHVIIVCRCLCRFVPHRWCFL